MKTLADAIFEAEKHTKKAPKEEALSGLSNEDLKLVWNALNPFRVFNIKKYDAPKAYASKDPDGYQLFFKLLDDLHTHAISGNAAKAAVTYTLSQYTERTAKALARVLDQDLKCGATLSTFKKIYPTINVPEFDLMGAEKLDKTYKWEFPCDGEAKYDGTRVIAMIDNGVVTYRSRNGKPYDHLAGVFDDEVLAFQKLLMQKATDPICDPALAQIIDMIRDQVHNGSTVDIVLDGEALANSFQETVKAKGSKNDDAKGNLKFYVFDFMTKAEWDAQNCKRVQEVRSAELTALVTELGLPQLVKSKSRRLNNMEEAFAFYNEVLEEGKAEDGTMNGLGEGLIIKKLKAPYQWNMSGSRSDSWAKWKPVLDFDLKCIGWYPGDPGTKNEDKCGGLVFEGKDENGRPILTNCGGFKVSDSRMQPWLNALGEAAGVQFKDAKKPNFVKNKDQWLRKYISEHFDEFEGRTFQLEAQEMSLAENATVYALRFPQLVMPRDDK